MDQAKILELRDKVNRLLAEMRIGKAIQTVKEMLEESGLKQLIGKAEQIQDTYRFMTRYLLEGLQDAGREQLLESMKQSLRSLADMAVRAARMVDSPDYYYSTLRFNRLRDEKLSELLSEYGNVSSELGLAEAVGDDNAVSLRKSRQDLMSRLFDTLLTYLGAENDYSDLTGYLTSGYADDTVIAQSLSALTLALMVFYDKAKFNSLLDIYEHSDNEMIRARALTGIVLSMIPNADRIKADSRLMARLSLWNDSFEDYRNLLEVVKAIVGTRDTERVANKMKDEVLPELMKLRPDIMKAIKEHSLDPESIAENNPEWEELLSKTGLEEKMRELSEMQSDGADLMMVTFSNLKQFPFFNKASNWFLPFDPRHTDLNLSSEMQTMIEMMNKAGTMVCDSDLYSLALATNHLPAAQMSMMSRQISENFEQLSEEAKANLSLSSAPKFDAEVVKVVRDLYRFFKLFRKREGFFDPFAKPLRFLQLPVIGDILSDNETLSLFGEFYFKRGYYADALPLLQDLSEERNADATLMEKIGYCLQSEGDFQGALVSYERAALLKKPGPWLTKKLAFVNRCLGNFEESAEYYSKALEMDPENVSLMMNAGNMLLEIGDIAGALGHFYHANYLRSDNLKVQRAIAWTELLNGNYDKAADYYSRIIATEAQASDYLNAGHAAFLLGNNKEALNFYRLAASEDPKSFEQAFISDVNQISGLKGYDQTAHQLLLDLALS